MIGKLKKRVRMAFASSGALVTVVVLLVLTAGVAVAASFPTYQADIIQSTSPDGTWDGLAGNDKIYGWGADNTFSGNEGDDTILGGTGALDTLSGDEGNDKLYGGWTSTITGDGANYVYGGPGNDTLKGADGYDELYGQSGNDKLYGSGDAVAGDYLEGGPGINTYTGSNGDDEIQAKTPEDGGGAAETIKAGAGSDTIFADDGIPDKISCGDHYDFVNYDEGIDTVGSDCEEKYPSQGEGPSLKNGSK